MSYTSLLYHVVFSTKDRRNLIPSDLQPRVWSYMGGIANKNGFKLLAAGGIENHVHLLLSLPATMSIAKAVQLIKAGSSKWMRGEMGHKLFTWQEEYGAFTISISQFAATRRYIADQRQHHKGFDFAAEWDKILEKHGLKQYER
jgi:putative transposase